MGPEGAVRPGARPHLLAPVDRPGEASLLLAAGAGWLYGGVLPREWVSRFPPLVPLNQRTFPSAQFPTLEALASAISETRAGGGHFALVLNSPFYLGEQLPLALGLAASAAEAGAEAVIVGDPGLLRVLKGAGLPLALHLSVMGGAWNPAAVGLFRRLGANRVILPRHLRLSEISALAAASPGVEFEAFLLVGKCPNVEGVCSFLHDSPGQAWPCEWPWVASFPGGGAVPPRVRAGTSPPSGQERRDACGFCALPELIEAGVTGFKVVGRGAPTPRKVALVTAAADALASAARQNEAGGATEWRKECHSRYRGLFRHSCTPRSCYFPELWEGE